jgi:hypothetical protein
MTSGDHTLAEFGAVVDWLDGRLDAENSARIERLVLAGSPDVVATVAWLQRFHAAVGLPVEPVPEGLTARLWAIGPAPHTAVSTREPSRLERLTGLVRASLTFDSLQTQGLAMARSSADATRQLVLSGPGLDVAVDLSEVRNGVVGSAQLLPIDGNADAVDVLVQTWARTGLVCEQRSDALGWVELGVLPAEVVVIDVDRTSAWPPMYAEVDLRRPG